MRISPVLLIVVSSTLFEQAAGPSGSIYLGSPETVASKIASTVETLGASRFDMKYSAGTLPHET